MYDGTKLGQYESDTDNATSLPSLSASQLTKLRMLTLVDLASKHQSLSYGASSSNLASLHQELRTNSCTLPIKRTSAQLLPALDLTSIRQLEDLIIEALYSDLIKARINQKRQVLEVDSVVGRDVKTINAASVPFGKEKTVDNLLHTLSMWYDRVGTTLSEVDYHIQGIKQRE